MSIPTAFNPLGTGGISPLFLWYYAPEQVTLYTQNGVKNHTFANGKGIIRVYNPITTVDLWLYQNAAITKVVLPRTVAVIGMYAFRDCSALTRIEIPSTVTAIGGGAFTGCTNLVMSTLPESLTTIGNMAFNACSKVTFNSIPAGVATIGNWAFQSCSSITSLRFRGTPQSIEARAFLSNANLTDIYVPWAEGAVANAPWGAASATIHYNS